MPDPDTILFFPALGGIYQTLAVFAQTLLRVIAGLALVPHGLRMTFGCFDGTGLKIRNIGMLADELDKTGWRPGRLWAPAISITELVCGPLLAIGLFTRLAALPVLVFLTTSNIERWRVGGYFWNTLGLEYTLMWSTVAFYFVVHGGGAWSIDRLLIGREL